MVTAFRGLTNFRDAVYACMGFTNIIWNRKRVNIKIVKLVQNAVPNTSAFLKQLPGISAATCRPWKIHDNVYYEYWVCS